MTERTLPVNCQDCGCPPVAAQTMVVAFGKKLCYRCFYQQEVRLGLFLPPQPAVQQGKLMDITISEAEA